MKKIAKLSLVAAMALTTSAFAGGHGDMGIKASGSVSYHVDKTLKNAAGNADEGYHDLDIRVTLSKKLNDMVTATVRLDETQDDDKDDKSGANTNDSKDSSDKNLGIDRAYITYKNNGLTSTFGLVGAPLTDGGSADGITVSKSFDNVTLGAAYYYQLGSDKVAAHTDDALALTASGKVAMVSYSALYAQTSAADAKDGGSGNEDHKIVNLVVGTDLGAFNAKLAYAQATGDKKQTKITLGTKVGVVSASLAYQMNGKDGADNIMIDNSDVGVTGFDFDIDSDAAEDKMMLLTLAGNIDAKNSVKLRYGSLMADAKNSDKNQIRVNYAHKMSSNLTLDAEYKVIDGDAQDNAEHITKFGAKYSF